VKDIAWLSEFKGPEQWGWHQKPHAKTFCHFPGLDQICKIMFKSLFQPSDYIYTNERSHSSSVFTSFPQPFDPSSQVAFQLCYTKAPNFKLAVNMAQSRTVRQRRETPVLLSQHHY